MISLGCDAGALFTKLVLMGEDRLLASRTIRTTGRIEDELEGIVTEVLEAAGASRADVAFLGATGAGAARVPGADFTEDEIMCVGAAASYYLPGVELVLHTGGQSIAALQVGPDGDVVSFHRNDKCAAGTGRFLEMMSGRLETPLAELDALAARATAPRDVSTQCVVFAESEAISHINAGVGVPDIVAGIAASIGRIVATQGRRVRDATAFTVTGGVARFDSVVAVIAERLALPYRPFPENPQLAAALGAALLEEEEA